MFETIGEVHKAFMELFYKAPIVVSIKGVGTVVPVRYANLSSFDYSEEQYQQIYPIISIYDYAPESSDKWNLSGDTYFGNYGNEDADDLPTTAERYYPPAYLTFRYDVGVAAKGNGEWQALQTWMHLNFVYDDPLILKGKEVDGEIVGIPITTSVDVRRVPRPDGIFETNYEIKFETWVNLKAPLEVVLVKELNVSANPINL